MQDLFDRYGALLAEVDAWFASALEREGTRIFCRSGCSDCCRGLFDITLLDALYLRHGFDQLPEGLRAAVQSRAKARLEGIAAAWPAFASPWLLNGIPEEQWDDLMPDEDESPCVFLQDGICLAYQHRPMTCRLHGLPLLDSSGELLFDEWCSLNFTDVDPLVLHTLRHPFNDLFAQELLLFRELTTRLVGVPVNELDTIIPAVPFIAPELIRHKREFILSICEDQTGA